MSLPSEQVAALTAEQVASKIKLVEKHDYERVVALLKTPENVIAAVRYMRCTAGYESLAVAVFFVYLIRRHAGLAPANSNLLMPDEKAKLIQALDLLGDVQCARAKIPGNSDESIAAWRELYRIRAALNNEIRHLSGERTFP